MSRDADGFPMNTRWKSITSREGLLKVLRANPHLAVFDTRNRESRFVLRTGPDAMTQLTVDGRSFRAAYFALKRRDDGGYIPREVQP